MKKQTKSAGKIVVLENADRISAETEGIQNRIRERAFELSQMRGHPGREVDDWLSAESEVISIPPMDMIEKDGTFLVQMAAPGIDPAELDIMASPEQMLVKCDLHHNHEQESGILHVCDFKSATLFRSFRFPEAIDVQSVEVGFQDGMLRITAAKEGSMAQRRPAARKSATTRSKRRIA